MSDEEYDAGDRDKVQARRLASKSRQKEHEIMVAALMDTVPGRAWIWELLLMGRVFQSSFSSRALEMAFNEGQRNFGLQLMAEIMRICPNQYITMARENGDEK